MRGCAACGFAWNVAFDPRIIVYDGDYENDQTHSPAFLAHLRDRARAVVSAVAPGEPVDYLEIGCGQGIFIGAVADAAGEKLRSATGFDPAWRGLGSRGPGDSCIHAMYFDQASANRLDRRPNVVACRHTIEHVPDPLGFLRSVRAALGPESRARVFIETPCLEWIVRHEAMQDFFYEHCSIFTASSLRYALEASGFGVRQVAHVFGGQYLWAEAEAVEHGTPARLTPLASGDFAGAQRRFTARWRLAAERARREGPVAIWGAGAKGVTFALLVDADGALFDHAIDINPHKQGLHMPTSGLLVLSPGQSAIRQPRTIFVMNPNYLAEIRDIAVASGGDAKLIPVN
ncbi:MAG TPA: class I SAM-dependent methyltransferase [Caulobacteraceae bacterium]|nr:class I SAM-dependent methyltransferase [Caulobacteraceae bacterium]